MNEPKFASEAAMCAEFIGLIGDDWVAYPETHGWDILLSRKADGFQIGIQAKMRLNAKVIDQAIENYYDVDRDGPDCRAVLVPMGGRGDYVNIAAHVGLTIIEVRPGEKTLRRTYRGWINPTLPNGGLGDRSFHECIPAKRHVLPDYIPDVAAGAAAPVQLTDWKIRAIKISLILEMRGFVTRDDFKAIKIDHRRWTANWLKKDEAGRGWVAGYHLPDFKLQHPVNYEQIKADQAKWMPPEPAAPLVIERLAA